MTAAHKNECPVAAGQVVKTLTGYASNFIAFCTHIASVDAGLCVAVAVVLLQAVLMVAWGML
jgi:hypothetical protein